MTHPLWQLLILTKDPDQTIQLTCAECFALLEYDAELLSAGVDTAEIRPNINHHLALCSSCRTQIDDWLDKLEREKKPSA